MRRCDHCLAAFPDAEALLERDGEVERLFCCAGCLGVWRLVREEGLGRFYEERRWEASGLPAAVRPGAAPLADLSAYRPVVAADGSAEIDVAIEGIRCASCIWLNERVLQRTPGVLAARVNYATHRARIRYYPATIALPAVLSRVQAAGYVPHPWVESEQARARDQEVRDLLIRVGTAWFLASQLMIYSAALYAGYFQGMDRTTRSLLEWISIGLAAPVLFSAGAPFWRSTLNGLRHGRFNMDSLVVLGSGAALAYSVWQALRGGEVWSDTAAMIPTLVLTGRYVEARARRAASEAVARLATLRPREALLVTAGEDGTPLRRRVPIEQVRVGDRIEVVPGERIPLDGRVVEGRSEADEGLVTGESRPVAKFAGEPVIGGSINLAGALSVEVTRVGADTLLAGIIRAVEEAQAEKPRLQALADRAVGVFVPVVLLLGAATLAGHLWLGASAERALLHAIAVVVIACPLRARAGHSGGGAAGHRPRLRAWPAGEGGRRARGGREGHRGGARQDRDGDPGPAGAAAAGGAGRRRRAGALAAGGGAGATQRAPRRAGGGRGGPPVAGRPRAEGGGVPRGAGAGCGGAGRRRRGAGRQPRLPRRRGGRDRRGGGRAGGRARRGG